ncbi:MAG: hypothetical protein ACOYBQ_10245 [Fluviibacter sp.]
MADTSFVPTPFDLTGSGYAENIDTIAPGFLNQIDLQSGSNGESWVTAAARAMSTVVMTDYQRKLLNVQLDRAKQGLPAIPMSDYGVGVGVNIGISPEVQKMLMLGGAALLAVYLLTRKG